MTGNRDRDANDDLPKEPEGLEVHWDQGKEGMTIEEMLENDLIVEQVEYLENVRNDKNICE